MKIILGADHGGFKLKESVKQWLIAEGYEVEDVGATDLKPDDDYVYYAKQAVKSAVSSDDRIVLFCRNGFGMEIAANRFVGVRCGLAFNDEAVRRGRVDDDINALSIPADYIGEAQGRQMIETFLKSEKSSEDRYKRRIMQLDNLL